MMGSKGQTRAELWPPNDIWGLSNSCQQIGGWYDTKFFSIVLTHNVTATHHSREPYTEDYL